MRDLTIALMLFCGLAAGQGPRVFILTDLEGVGGIHDADEQLLPGQRRFEESRRLLAGELNAAIEGAFAAGASEVVVWDGHDGSRTLSVDLIDRRAKLIQGKPTPANYYLSEKAYDGILFIGQHAMSGAPNSILAHTQSFEVKRLTINGKPVGEIGQTAAIAGHFGIPVIMLAGDEAACAEIRELQPKAITVAVKRLVGRASALSLSHEEARRRIQAAAREAVSRIREFEPWRISGPVELRFDYVPRLPAYPEGRVAVYRGSTVLEAFEAWLGRP